LKHGESRLKHLVRGKGSVRRQAGRNLEEKKPVVGVREESKKKRKGWEYFFEYNLEARGGNGLGETTL